MFVGGVPSIVGGPQRHHMLAGAVRPYASAQETRGTVWRQWCHADAAQLERQLSGKQSTLAHANITHNFLGLGLAGPISVTRIIQVHSYKYQHRRLCHQHFCKHYRLAGQPHAAGRAGARGAGARVAGPRTSEHTSKRWQARR